MVGSMCMGISIPFLTSPLLSHYPPHPPLSICIPWYPLPGPHSKANDFCLPSPMTFQKSTHQILSTFCVPLHSCLDHIGRASDALGQVYGTLCHHVNT
jgi:hypothetical protein